MRTPPPLLIAALTLLLLSAFGGTVWALREIPLPDFAALEVAAKKQRFFDFLRPHVEQANANIRLQRARLEVIAEDIEQYPPNWLQRRFLLNLAAEYDLEVPAEDDYSELTDELLMRVDVVPAALMLIQAAKESAWGTSKFAVMGNNLFGQQCFAQGCGYIPTARDSGRRHEVARFDSVDDAVRAYLHNVNTHPRYQTMREIRAQLRSASDAITGTRLADGLLAYSERREDYVEEVKDMIRQNNLE